MHRIVGSFFGTGLVLRRLRGSDSGSGTVGALAAAILAYPLYQRLDWPWQIGAALLVTLVAAWSLRALVDAEGDAGWIVADEAAGTFIALIGIANWTAAIVAFVVFRTADIFKQSFPGVSRAERMEGAAGVLADDLVAGLYGLAAAHVVQSLV
ncbi:MAG: phosphatidylglycerophosphatase A [Acidimicrobiia bacterium]|nr:phosphatidylglycerophosphatase A [Acidimicrobiia bacterium]